MLVSSYRAALDLLPDLQFPVLVIGLSEAGLPWSAVRAENDRVYRTAAYGLMMGFSAKLVITSVFGESPAKGMCYSTPNYLAITRDVSREQTP